jgi:hypothetical protein
LGGNRAWIGRNGQANRTSTPAIAGESPVGQLAARLLPRCASNEVMSLAFGWLPIRELSAVQQYRFSCMTSIVYR